MHFLPFLCVLASATFVKALSSPQTLHLQRRASPNGTQLPSYYADFTSTTYGTRFDVNVTLGNQTFALLVDTGSSDTWVVGSDYLCINDTSNAILPQQACAFTPQTYRPSPTFQLVPDEFFGEQLGSGKLSGLVGREDVTLGGVTVKGQQIGVANKTSQIGDGIDSGLVGFGYPSLTAAHLGSIVNVSNTTFNFDIAVYNPLFVSMYKQGLVEPYFSVALERTPINELTGPGGYLTLGGIPPVPHDSNFSRTPVEITPVPVNYTGNKPQRSWWTINIEGVTYGSSADSQDMTTNSTNFLAVVDTGNWFNFHPPELVEKVNRLFDPPGEWKTDPNGIPTYIVDCNATAPAFGYKIGGQTFFHNGKDLITNVGGGVCVSSLVSNEDATIGGVTAVILGDAFLKNVVAVFDFGKNEMRFAARTGDAANTSSATPPPSASASTGAAIHLASRTWFMTGGSVLAAMVGSGALNWLY
jgi:hypothetical protein